MPPKPSQPKRAWRRQWRALPYVGDEHPGWRALAVRVLLRACLDAHAGRLGARQWLESDQARLWADLVGLPDWPPRPEQLSSFAELQRRVRAWDAASEPGDDPEDLEAPPRALWAALGGLAGMSVEMSARDAS